MYYHIGKKVRYFAVALCIIGVLASIGTGVYLYAEEKLAGNNPLRGQCEICGKTTDLVNAKIEDKLGTRYRKLCRECYMTNNCKPAD